MIQRLIHPKVRWAAYGSALAAVLTAFLGSVGEGLNPTVAAVLAGVAAFLGGYKAPAQDAQDPEAPDA